MPGWAGPGVPSFQVDEEEALKNQQAAAQAAQDTAAAQDSAAAQDPGAVQASPTQESAGAKDSFVSADEVESEKSTTASSSADSDPSEVGQAIQSMTKMFDQRRQIQAQQNQASRQQQSPAD